MSVEAQDGRTWVTWRAPNAALRLYILAALQTGGRRGELASLLWTDVDMKARTISVRSTKNGLARSVPMSETL